MNSPFRKSNEFTGESVWEAGSINRQRNREKGRAQKGKTQHVREKARRTLEELLEELFFLTVKD